MKENMLLTHETIDKFTAYRRNLPIRTPADEPQLKTNAPNEEWNERMKSAFWHINNIDKTVDKKLYELRFKLLSFGGHNVVLPKYEEDIDNILKYGQLWIGDKITMKKGLPSQCHYNSCQCHLANRDKTYICTGYALSEDGLWRQHSWLIWTKPRVNRIVETTTPRVAYFGFAMTPDEMNEFIYNNT